MTLQHVALEVRPADAAAEVAFWAHVGFAEVDVPEGLRGRSRWVGREGLQVHLLLTEDPVVPPAGHVAVVAEPFGEVGARLAAAGFVPQLREAHWGAVRAFVTTPAGHRVELMEAPPA